MEATRRTSGLDALCRLHVHGSRERNQPVQARISRPYLFVDDEGRTYEAPERNGFREIPVEEAIARVEAPLQEMGETLETPYDSAYISRKDAALREAGFDVLRIRIVPEDGAA